MLTIASRLGKNKQKTPVLFYTILFLNGCFRCPNFAAQQ
jgi:hypothetical protein